MSVIRIVHNRENPYVQLNKQALWNVNLSLKAIGLWARCLSRPDDWEFHVSEMASSGKEGKDAVLAAINELISEGYALRIANRKSDTKRFESVVYIIFEFPISEEEKSAYGEEFKKMFPVQEKPLMEKPLMENPQLLKKDKELKTDKEIKEVGSDNPLPSTDVEASYSFFLNKIKERKPDFKEPNEKEWKKGFDRLLRIDKRSFSEVMDLIEWASSHKWWGSACLSPEKLRKEYDSMILQMKNETKKAPTKSNQIEINRKTAVDVKVHLKSSGSKIWIDPKGYVECTTFKGTKETLSLDMNTEIFENTLLQWFNLERE